LTVSLLLQALASSAQPATNALADYVRRPDDSFAWKKASQRPVDSFQVVEVACTSQTWRENVWHHQLLLVRPAQLRHPDTAFLFITGSGKVERELSLLQTLAERAGGPSPPRSMTSLTNRSMTASRKMI
jgi:PhoPQ-activated pathogenicity-related protein